MITVVLTLVLVLADQAPINQQLVMPDIATCEQEAHAYLSIRQSAPGRPKMLFHAAGCAEKFTDQPGVDVNEDHP